MVVDLKPGSRFASVTCETEVVAVKGSGGIDLRCGGEPMVPVGESEVIGPPAAGFDEGTLVGKRYVGADGSIELLCTKAGAGSLSIGEDVLEVKGAKPLPSSD